MLRFFSLPRINDISTDLDAPPSFREGSGKPCAGVSYPSSFKSKVRTGYPDLGPLNDGRDATTLFEAAVKAAEQTENWTVEHVDADNHTLEAIATTPTLKFKDDIVVRVTERDSGSRLDVRSRSRLGKHDFGANADRIRAFIAAVRKG